MLDKKIVDTLRGLGHTVLEQTEEERAEEKVRVVMGEMTVTFSECALRTAHKLGVLMEYITQVRSTVQ